MRDNETPRASTPGASTPDDSTPGTGQQPDRPERPVVRPDPSQAQTIPPRSGNEPVPGTAGAGPRAPEINGPGTRRAGTNDAGTHGTGTHGTGSHGTGSHGTGSHALAEFAPEGGHRQHLLTAEELGDMVSRWRNIQAEFVDEPKTAVADADALVSDLMRRLTEVLASERAALESRLTSAGDLSTEDLRQGLRSYRSFFERLLAT